MKPILFNTEMVQAILDGSKTETRRVIKLKGKAHDFDYDDDKEKFCFMHGDYNDGAFYEWEEEVKAPYKIGDILYVRETWAVMPYGYVYLADDEKPVGWERDDRWDPSIHMPKEAARLFLRVKDVYVGHLHDITDTEARHEGFANVDDFAKAWDSMTKASNMNSYGWDADPWVWEIHFERIAKPEED